MTASTSLDFVCVGSQKSGTSWLNAVLRRSEGICLPTTTKETFFFDRHYHLGTKWHLSHFPWPVVPGIAKGEISPSYFTSLPALFRLREQNPQCKILIFLRDPVERTLSHIFHLARRGLVDIENLKAIEQILQDPGHEAVAASMYHTLVPLWTHTFGAERTRLFLFDTLRDRPDKLISEVTDFLGLTELGKQQTPRAPTGEVVYPRATARSKAVARTSYRISQYLQRKGFSSIVYKIRGMKAGTLLEKPNPGVSDSHIETITSSIKTLSCVKEAEEFFQNVRMRNFATR